jgi:hypothetical protein
MRRWQPVKKVMTYVVLGLIMLMGIMQKPTLKSYFSCDAFTEIPILPQTMTQGRFDLIKKILYFVDNNTVSTYTGTKKKFKNLCLLSLEMLKKFKVHTSLQKKKNNKR